MEDNSKVLLPRHSGTFTSILGRVPGRKKQKTTTKNSRLRAEAMKDTKLVGLGRRTLTNTARLRSHDMEGRWK